MTQEASKRIEISVEYSKCLRGGGIIMTSFCRDVQGDIIQLYTVIEYVHN